MNLRNLFFNTSGKYFLPIHGFFKNSSNVVCFHRVSDEDSSSYPPMKVDLFGQIIHYFSKQFDVVDLKDIKHQKGYRKIAITFDDGYMDFKDNALPILASYKIPVTQNLITSCLDEGIAHWTQQLTSIADFVEFESYKKVLRTEFGFSSINSENREKFSLDFFHFLKSKEIEQIHKIINHLLILFGLTNDVFVKMLKWKDIKEINNQNNSVKWGCHTQTHSNLGEERNVQILKNEIMDSKTLLENNLGHSIDRFAFPNGHSSLEAYNFTLNQYQYIQFTEHIPQFVEFNPNVIRRYQLYYPGFYENIHKSLGFHNFISRP
jgi:peptidoglycan/xylan/chitin deacetylase (PgdA/CDA1 family)